MPKRMSTSSREIRMLLPAVAALIEAMMVGACLASHARSAAVARDMASSTSSTS